MAEITTTQAFSDGDTVTATKLNNITANAAIQTEAITNRSAETTVDQANDLLLMYDASATALKKVTLSNVIKAGTASNFPVTGNATIGGTLGVTGASTLTGNTSVGGTLGVSGDATLSGNLSVTGNSVVKAGTAASPAIQPTGDTNTGIFFPAADTIAFSDGGTEAMRIDSNGRVGIGTTSPSLTLDINAPLPSLGITATTGTERVFARATNTGGNFYFGIDSSTGGLFGGAAYARTLHSDGAYPIAIYTNATERLRITSGGNLLIGTTVEIQKVSLPNNTSIGWVNSAGNGSGQIIYGDSAGGLQMFTSNTERLRIDSSGNLLVGTTTTPSSTVSGFMVNGFGSLTAVPSANINAAFYKPSSPSNSTCLQFVVGGSQVGSVTLTNTATAYNTSSDYRLKEDVAPMTGALTKIAALKPVTYKWKVDGSAGDGFIAHEAQAIVPECVTGEKDAVDADGKPIYQGIDQSKIVPLLTAALKEAIAKIEQLESKVAALEAA